MKNKLFKNTNSLLTVLFLSTFIIFIATPNFSFAAGKGGVKPGSFFYSFDILLEKIDLALTFNKEERVVKIMDNVEERLEEAESAISQNKPAMAEKALSKYQKGISSAFAEVKKIDNKEKKENLLSIIDDNGSKREEVLNSIYEKVPEASKDAIKRAIAAGTSETQKSSASSKPELEHRVSPPQGRPEKVNRCGDGVCDEFEKANTNACPADCKTSSASSKPELEHRVSPPQGKMGVNVNKNEINTFVMIHFEAGYKARLENNLAPDLASSFPEKYILKSLGWQEFFWPTAVNLVEKADEFDFKLILAFNPQWAEYILKDSAKVGIVKQWQENGHEIAFHHHAMNHVDWNGYSNNPDDARDSLYLGTSDEGFAYVNNLVKPDSISSGTLGGLPDDFPSALRNKDFVLIGGNQFDSYGEKAKSLEPIKRFKPDGGYVMELTMREFSTVMDMSMEEAFSELKKQYEKIKDNEIFGIVWHEFDYYLEKEKYIEWFEFIKNRGDKVRTAKDILARSSSSSSLPLRSSSSKSSLENVSKCGDGVCGPIEKTNPNLCPRDCVNTARSSSSSFSSSKSSSSSVVSTYKSSSSLSKIVLSSSYRLPFGMLTSFYPTERTGGGERPTEYKWETSSNDNPPFFTAFDMGIGWERASHPVLDWSFVQKKADDLINKKYDWSVSDNYIKKVPNFLNLVITLNVGDSRLNAGTWQFPNPILKTEYANFVKAAVERYDGDGVSDMPGLKSPVKHWQFENEPVSHVDRSGGKPQPNYDWEGFSELLKITYESVKSADSSAKVLVAGTVDAEPQRQNILDNFWLPLIGNLNGKYADIFDIHWFSKWQDSYAFYNQFKNKMNQSGFSQTPVWMTENGSSSKEGEGVQAKDLVKRMVYPLSYGVKKVFWAWGLVEGWPPFDCSSMFDYTGLIYDGVCSPDEGYGVKKLGFYTYKKLIGTLNGSNFDNVQKIQESGGVYVYKFPRQGKDVWVAWNENTSEKQITISDINSSSIKITEAVPNYSSGKEVTNYNTAFKTETKTVSSGSVNITLGDTPVFVEGN